MVRRFLPGLALFLSPFLCAQQGTPQDPDKPQPKVEDRLAELTKEKERLTREIAFVKDRAANLGSMLKDKIANRALNVRSIDAGTSAAAPVATMQPRKARMMTPEERHDAGDDVLLIAAGRPVRQAQVDELMNYLRSSPTSGDDELRSQKVMFELIRTEATAGAFGDSARKAEAQIQAIAAELAAGKPFEELAKQSTGPGADQGGKIEVTRNTYFGVKLEQVAFTTKEGGVSSPFLTPMGWCILRCNKQLKGETPDSDRVECGLIQIALNSDPKQLGQIQSQVATGQIDLALRDEKVMAMLPPLFRPMADAAAQPGTIEVADTGETGDMNSLDARIRRTTEQLKMIQTELDRLQGGASTPDEKARLEKLQQIHKATVQELARLADEKAKTEGGGKKDADGDVKHDGGKPAPKK